MEKKNTESRWALAFSVTTAALLLFGILMQLLPLLGAFGCINDWVAHPFSAHMLANATYVAPQLGILFALQKK